MKKKTIPIILMLAILVMSGCRNVSQESQTIPIASELPLPSESAEPQAQDRKLNISMPSGVSSLNPLLVKDQELLDVLSLMFDPAISIDATGKAQFGVISAAGYDEESGVLICQVRDNVTFHSGEQVKAADLVAELEYIMSLDASTCSYSAYKDVVESVSVDEQNDMRFNITLKELSADIFYLLSFPVVSQSTMSSNSSDVVGTGAYSVKSFSSDSGLKLQRNENWWKAAPAFSSITAKPYATEDERKEAYLAGKIDIMPVSQSTARELRSSGSAAIYNVTTPYYDCILLNHRCSIFSDSAVRAAISSCINRTSIISGSLSGAGLAADTPLRTDYWFFEKQPVDAYSKTQAEKALDDAGTKLSEDEYGNPLRKLNGKEMEFTVIYTESSEMYYKKTVLEMVKTQLAEFGITMNIEALTAAEYKSRLESGDFDAAFSSYYTKSNQDISFFFGEEDYSHASSSELDRLIESANASITEDEQRSAFIALQEGLESETPHIGLYFRELMLAVRPEITNITAMRFEHIYENINEWTFTDASNATESAEPSASAGASPAL